MMTRISPTRISARESGVRREREDSGGLARQDGEQAEGIETPPGGHGGALRSEDEQGAENEASEQEDGKEHLQISLDGKRAIHHSASLREFRELVC